LAKAKDDWIEKNRSFFSEFRHVLTAWDVLCALNHFAGDFPKDVPEDLVHSGAWDRTPAIAELYADLLCARDAFTLGGLLDEFRAFVDEPEPEPKKVLS
jgi:hypothetical protein